MIFEVILEAVVWSFKFWFLVYLCFFAGVGMLYFFARSDKGEDD